MSFVFFFQAEDGIRDRNVTGVQTCALPIFDELAAPPVVTWSCRAASSSSNFRRPCPSGFPEIGRASCRERVENTEEAGVLKEKKEVPNHATQQQGAKK